MARLSQPTWLAALLSENGMLLALLLLIGVVSAATYGEQQPTGDAAARQLAPKLKDSRVLIVVRDNARDALHAEQMERTFAELGVSVAGVVKAQPPAARDAIAQLAKDGLSFDAYVVNRPASAWTIYARLGEEQASLRDLPVHAPESYYWPSFLRADNLINVANQVAIIAIMAIGMTMVIIVGGIDLSVGSLIALAAVITTRLIRDVAGAEEADTLGMIFCSIAGIGVCGLVGLFSGAMVTGFGMPAFIVTLGVMLAASGAAYLFADGQSIHQIPETFIWLGREADLFRIPNAVVLMVVLYLLAHVLMSRTVLGRYIYAVGGNIKAAWYSGIPVRRVILSVYVMSGLLAGLGGVIMASQLKSGSPTYGQMYELFVIAAVVVGGTSLSGGRGKVFGTLIGVLIIGVIQNGMNLVGLTSYTQKVVLGGVILVAVLIDCLRRKPNAINA